MGLFSFIPLAKQVAEEGFGYDTLPSFDKQKDIFSREASKFDLGDILDPRNAFNPDKNPLSPISHYPTMGWSDAGIFKDGSVPAEEAASSGGSNYYGGYGGGAPSFSLDDFMGKLDQIASSPLATESIDFPDVDKSYLFEQRANIEDYIQGIRSGEIKPETTSPELRQQLIDRADTTFGRVLDASTDANLEELSRRGILGSAGGYSGPAAKLLAETRAKTYEDPLTSFVRDFDINTELERVKRLQQLNDQATTLSERLLQSGETEAALNAKIAADKAQLELSNLVSRRNYVSGVGSTVAGIGSSDMDRALRERLGLLDADLKREGFDLSRDLAEAERSQRDLEAERSARSNFYSELIPTVADYFGNRNVGGSSTNYFDGMGGSDYGVGTADDYGFGTGLTDFNLNQYAAPKTSSNINSYYSNMPTLDSLSSPYSSTSSVKKSPLTGIYTL